MVPSFHCPRPSCFTFSMIMYFLKPWARISPSPLKLCLSGSLSRRWETTQTFSNESFPFKQHSLMAWTQLFSGFSLESLPHYHDSLLLNLTRGIRVQFSSEALFTAFLFMCWSSPGSYPQSLPLCIFPRWSHAISDYHYPSSLFSSRDCHSLFWCYIMFKWLVFWQS